MENTFLFLPTSLMQSLSTWLLHSVWIGILLALAASLIITFTRHSRSAVRYNLLLASLALFLATMTAILIWQLSAIPAASVERVTLLQPSDSGVFTVRSTVTPGSDLPARLLEIINSYSPAIVSAWFLILIIRCIRLAGGLYAVNRLRRTANEPVAEEWNRLLAQLSRKLGLERKVTILQSYAVEVPLVIGHLKPVILLPLQLMTSLPAAQVEAILLHELAHIMRRDYLVNLLVNVVEAIFFFNPAVIWLSSLIRKERENCCDDVALQLVGKPQDYIDALLSCQQFQQAPPRLAATLFTKRQHLLGRVKRMIYKHHNPTLNNMEKSIVTISLLTAGLLALAFTGKPPATQQTNQLSGLSAAKVLTFTDPLLANSNFTLFPFVNWSARSADTIPAPPVPNTPPDPPAPPSHTGTPAAATAPPSRIGTPATAPVPATPVPPPAKTPVTPASPAVPVVPADRSAAVTNTRDAVSTLKVTNAKQGDVILNKKLDPLAQQPVNVQPLQTDGLSGLGPARGAVTADSKQRSPRAIQPLSAISNEPTPPTPPPGEVDKQRDQILAEMVAEGLIPARRDHLSFKLSTKEFIINGKRQPAAVFEKYRKRYEKRTGNGQWSWYYNYNSDTVVQ